MAGSKTPEKKAAPTGGKPAAKAAAKPAAKTSQPATGKQQTPAAASKKAAAPPAKPAAETVAATSSVADGDENGLTIPHRYRVDTKRKALVAYCDLPRVPQKYIVCEPTSDTLHVSTPQWSRKYSLTEPYPDGIKVDGEKAEAEFDGKVLQVALPITFFPESAKQKQAKLTSDIREGKQIRFKDEIGKGWKQLQAQAKVAKASEEEAKARAVAAVSGGVVPPKKGAAPPSAIVEEPEEKRTKKAKVFLNENDRVKQLMEAAGEAEADRVASKQQKMTLLQQMRMEAKQAKLEKRTRKAQQQQESVSKVLQQKKRKLEESNPGADNKGGKKGGAGGRPAKKAKK